MENKNLILVVAVVAIVSLVAPNLENLTGNVPVNEKAKSLSVSQKGSIITVQVNPRGNAGRPVRWIDMRAILGANHQDEQTRCDPEFGPKSGTSECVREIAQFSVTGNDWDAGDRVQFTIRGTKIRSAPYTIKAF